MQFVHAGSAVPGFSQNPAKGHRDLPSKITDPSKSDVDICIVGDGVLDSFLALEEKEKVKVKVKRYPSTTGRMSKGMRFSVKDFAFCDRTEHRGFPQGVGREAPGGPAVHVRRRRPTK